MARQSENRDGGQVEQHDGLPIQPQHLPTEPGRMLRTIALVAVAAGLAALTAGACVLSYEPIHHLAIQSNVSPRLASIYPLIFDALLILAGCSILALRGAGLISRIYAWLCLLVLLAGLAGGGAVHAAGIRFSRKLADVLAAVIPWVLVLIGFGLLLALLRYARLRRQAARSSRAQLPAPLLSSESPDVVLVTSNAVPAVPSPRPQPGTPLAATAAQGTAVPGAAAEGTAGPGAAGLAAAGGPSSGTTSLARTPGTGPPATPAPATANPPRTPGPSTPATPAPATPAAAGEPAAADLTKSGQDRPPVRQADLQLRARIPRPAPTAGRPPSAAGPAHAESRQGTPLMPPVGTQQPTSGTRQASAQQPGAQPPGAQQHAGSPAVQPASDTQPAGPTPSGPARGTSGPADATTAAIPQPEGSLSPAPTEPDDDEDAIHGGPPAFRRQRSSPTPPGEE